jgi:hypothetical protein
MEAADPTQRQGILEGLQALREWGLRKRRHGPLLRLPAETRSVEALHKSRAKRMMNSSRTSRVRKQ